jgi:NADPH:quinone reductase-like Zn-dependent oxidoreductase
MRQIVVTRHGGTDVLKVQEKPEPRPGPGEVVVSVRAAGLNFADILARKGLPIGYPDAPKTPCVLGFEVSGVIRETGKDVDGSMIGREVLAFTRFGGQSEAVRVAVDQVFDKPKSLSFEEAAAIPFNYVTAYVLIVVMGSLRKEESVLIHNVGGGVGLAALDVAKHIGAKTYGTASTWKHPYLKERGLDYAIDYRTQDWLTVLNELTDGRGVELVIDPIGGKHWKKSYRALTATGRLGMFGISSASGGGLGGKLRLHKVVIQSPWFYSLTLINRNKGIFGLNLPPMWHGKGKVGDWMRAILAGVESGWVRPRLDRTFSFNQVSEAHAYLESRKNIGKVVLVP